MPDTPGRMRAEIGQGRGTGSRTGSGTDPGTDPGAPLMLRAPHRRGEPLASVLSVGSMVEQVATRRGTNPGAPRHLKPDAPRHLKPDAPRHLKKVTETP